MQRGSNSKRVSSGNSNDNYKSQSNKGGVSSRGQKFQVQNMKEFKCQIDHQIAKCLDTLDRQGLKFLKETLRASKLFGINTQELSQTYPVAEQSVESEVVVQKKEPVAPKKVENIKNLNIKKSVKVEVMKKPATAQKGGRNVEPIGNLGDKIHKKLQSLNIKTAKKTDGKQVKPVKEVEVKSKTNVGGGSSGEIAEQIQIEENLQNAMRESIPIQIQEEFMKHSGSYQLSPKKIMPVKNKTPIKANSASKKQQFCYVPEQSEQVLRPFSKKQNKKLQEQKQQKVGEIKQDIQEDIEEEIKQKQQNLQEEVKEQVVTLKESKIDQKSIIQIQEIQDQRVEQPNQSSQSLPTELMNISPQMLSLISKIKNLPASKMLKLQRVLQKLQDPQLTTSMLSLVSQTSKQQQSHLRPYISQKASHLNVSDMKEQKDRSHSRSRLQKHEKATSIKTSMIKRNKDSTESPLYKKERESAFQQSVPMQESKNTKSFVQDEMKSQSAVSLKIKKDKTETLEKKQQYQQYKSTVGMRGKEDHLSASISIGQGGQKLFKINKKKNINFNVTIKILSNNGHSSLVALNSIIFYSIGGDVLKITESHLKNNFKLLKLFGESSDSWVGSLSSAVINIEGISQPIGGIRIVNFNKSELQNSKQADMMEILINEQLHWRGQLKGGSFKESQSYITDIKVAVKDFQFPALGEVMMKSKFMQEKLMLDPLGNNASKLIIQEQKSENKDISWLQKESLSKIRQLQALQKNESSVKVKKIHSIRNTLPMNSLSESIKINQPQNEIMPDMYKHQHNFGNFKIAQEKGFNLESSMKPQGSKVKLQESYDILGELSLSINPRKKVEKQENKEELNRKEQEKKKGSEAAMKEKQKQQDQEFEQILRSLQKREKNIVVQPKKEIKKQIPVNKEKVVVDIKKENSFQDFMKDSLFDDLAPKQPNPKPQPSFKKQVPQYNQVTKPNQSKKVMKRDLDNLIDELNDVIGGENKEQTGQQFIIPELPKGKEITMVLLSNWGNQQHIGLNGLEFFDSNGDIARPNEVISSSVSSHELIDKLFKAQLLTSDQKTQVKLPKGNKVVLHFVFSIKIELAALRIWNYNGHRVHSNIGIKKCHLKMESQYIFSGQIRQSSGSSDDAHKYCEYILFTQSGGILKKIREKDWLSRNKRKHEEQTKLFKSTLENFHRPPTRNDEEAVKKENLQLKEPKEPIKLPKRLCFECQPPQLPEGFTLTFILHSNWGDRFFIGLNGIQIFNQKGQVITSHNLSQIRADPSSVSKLQGYQRDKRLVSNLINGSNTTTSDTNIWLAPLLSDVDRIQKGRPNIILLDYAKSNTISGINFYNYTKTPERGVREIEIYLDNLLIYRGYLRRYDTKEGIIHTTVNFTKEQSLLEAMKYVGYHQDVLEQQVGLVNEQKVVRQGNSSVVHQLTRPMTGKLLP